MLGSHNSAWTEVCITERDCEGRECMTPHMGSRRALGVPAVDVLLVTVLLVTPTLV